MSDGSSLAGGGAPERGDESGDERYPGDDDDTGEGDAAAATAVTAVTLGADTDAGAVVAALRAELEAEIRAARALQPTLRQRGLMENVLGSVAAAAPMPPESVHTNERVCLQG